MGTWYSPDEIHEQWEEFQRKHWQLGEPVSAEKFTRVRDAWNTGYANGHRSIKDE